MFLTRIDSAQGRFPAKPTLTSGARIDVMTGSSYKAFPALTKHSGRLDLLYRTGSAHNSAEGTIDYKTSDDDGATWDPAGTSTILIAATGSNDVRDPCILKSSTGRLIAAYSTRNPFDSATALVPRTFYSDDGGATWSSSVAISFSPSGTAFVTSQPIEVPDGDIWMPGTVLVAGLETAVIWKSTDDGATFPTQITIASGGRDYQEAQVRRLLSGEYVALLRSESNHHTWRTFSADGSSWSSPVDVNAMTGRPDFVEFAYGALVQFGRYLTSDDSPGFMAISYDKGETWGTPVEIDSGGMALWMYGAPIVDGSVVRLVYSLQNSGSDADLFQHNYAIT